MPVLRASRLRLRIKIEYQAFESGVTIPSGDWTEEIPQVAQGNYFQEAILTDSNVYPYKLEDNEAVKCTSEEIRGQREDIPADKMPGLESR